MGQTLRRIGQSSRELVKLAPAFAKFAERGSKSLQNRPILPRIGRDRARLAKFAERCPKVEFAPESTPFAEQLGRHGSRTGPTRPNRTMSGQMSIDTKKLSSGPGPRRRDFGQAFASSTKLGRFRPDVGWPPPDCGSSWPHLGRPEQIGDASATASRPRIGRPGGLGTTWGRPHGATDRRVADPQNRTV